MTHPETTSAVPEGTGVTEDPTLARVEHARLCAEVETHDRLYHGEDAPRVSDAEYDALRRRVAALEAAHPALSADNPRADAVGYAPSGRFPKVTHSKPMPSLGNAFSAADVDEFAARVARGAGAAHVPGFVGEAKIDGLSLTLRYEDGAGRGRHARRRRGGRGRDRQPCASVRRAATLAASRRACSRCAARST